MFLNQPLFRFFGIASSYIIETWICPGLVAKWWFSYSTPVSLTHQ